MDVLLAAAVEAVGGAERPGQVEMARAVAHAIDSGEHVAAQAGTGTGKSLAYLVPAIRHAIAERTTVVVSTATIALQRQLVDRDLPRLAEALRPLLGRELKFAILKGRRNYLCLHRVQTGAPEDPDDGPGLFDPQALSTLGRQVKRLNEWAETTTTGDRDELVPGVGEQAWRQVAVTARECLGAARCPQGTECFAELARAEAGEAHIVVTNHALLAIDALEEFQVLPEHDVVIVDEAHELVDRVTSVATGDLSGPGVEAAARRCNRLVEEGVSVRLAEAGEALGMILEDLPAGRMDVLSPALGTTLAVVRDAAHACLTAIGPEKKDADPADAGARKAARSALEELHDTAVRMLESFQPEIAARFDVVWLDKPFAQDGRPKRPNALYVAPIGVGGLLRTTLFEQRTAVLTSATLTLGGSFEPLARQWGLPPLDGAAARDAPRDARTAAEGLGRTATEDGDQNSKITWSGLDVGSPFDHPKAGILYVARHLPQPGRDGLPDAYLTEITELIEAAGGRTLGLFSSMRAARQAADELKDHLSHPLLCQGEDSTSLLVKRFAEEERTCLFGTLSLWQGVDVPGPALQLVIMDRIPFPRPDDPVQSARQRAVAARGGNGFMSVAATHAALLLAQGAGRLLRSMEDRGVVAILDPRLATARYGGFLKNSLPPFWATTDPQVVRGALRRLDAAADA
ncbi:ATP-dependent DNA helicase [Actinomadura parmotrematis]|uniref:DNA 5'-3' helicase n=1 Tax=Actinomadura parmotrematis TaxID=2864039 RepID=A0ABS7G4Z6_9ACTN|nr:ATP-dependent DNA helicase [Actinomadura parmotrematis]MBW8487606.1 ATP-dependent DNA helicase [Actinomadura parmotrematis]